MLRALQPDGCGVGCCVCVCVADCRADCVSGVGAMRQSPDPWSRTDAVSSVCLPSEAWTKWRASTQSSRTECCISIICPRPPAGTVRLAGAQAKQAQEAAKPYNPHHQPTQGSVQHRHITARHNPIHSPPPTHTHGFPSRCRPPSGPAPVAIIVDLGRHPHPVQGLARTLQLKASSPDPRLAHRHAATAVVASGGGDDSGGRRGRLGAVAAATAAAAPAAVARAAAGMAVPALALLPGCVVPRKAHGRAGGSACCQRGALSCAAWFLPWCACFGG